MPDRTSDEVFLKDTLRDPSTTGSPEMRPGQAARGILIALLLSGPVWIGLALAVRCLAERGGG